MQYTLEMNANPYPPDLTDAEWDLIKDFIPPPKPGGRHHAEAQLQESSRKVVPTEKACSAGRRPSGRMGRLCAGDS